MEDVDKSNKVRRICTIYTKVQNWRNAKQKLIMSG